MSRVATTGAILGALLLTASSTFAQSPSPGPDKSDKDSRPATSVPMTGQQGMFSVPADVFRELTEEAEHHFDRARTFYGTGERAKAAKELTKAAAFFKLEAARGHEGDRDRLNGEAATLEALGRRVASGDSTLTNAMLTDAFVTAHGVLAHHHYDLARQNWKGRDDADVSSDMAATLHHLSAANQWAGRPLDPERADHYVAVEALTQRMADQVGWASSEVDQALDFLQFELEKLDLGK